MHGYAAEQTRARISAPDQPRQPLPSNRGCARPSASADVDVEFYSKKSYGPRSIQQDNLSARGALSEG
jgi:hypothetical protein